MVLQSPISHEIMRVVAAHVVSGDKNDILLLDSVSLDDTPFELPPEREVTAETYLPSFVSIHVLNTRVRKQKY